MRPDDPACAEIDAAIEESRAATDELRELARGIHPAILTDRGLGPAIEALAGRATLAVTVTDDVDARLPCEVELAAYYTVAEALTNVSRHAQAQRAHVRLALLEDRLHVTVEDDGVGGADVAAGSGIRGLSDRAGAVGGELEVESPPRVAPGRGRRSRSERVRMARVKHALVTGFPGFIGRRLVKNLVDLHPKATITALVEPRMADAAREVAGTYASGKVAVVEGDIGERHLGMADDEYARLAKTVDTVFHLAAIYNLAVPLELAVQVNVDGTGNVLDFCADAKSLDRLVYTSTAYVAGDRTGFVYEHELVLGQGFKNHYESTKFQAEVWVRERMDQIPTVILRPAIVVGDSKTGETEKFDGPYYILRAIAKAESGGRPAMQFGRGDAPFNVVPVNFIAGAMAVAAGDDAMIGETLHLVDPAPLSSHDLMETLSNLYAGRGTRGRVPAGLVHNALRFGKVREAFNNTPRESIVYLNHPVRFDTRRAVELLAPHGLQPPGFADYAEPMVAFFKANEADPAFMPK